MISLDFEMMWGSTNADRSVRAKLERSVPHVPLIVERILQLFNRYSIHATWNVVGALACSGKQEARRLCLEAIPEPYLSSALSFVDQISDEARYFARALWRSSLVHTGNASPLTPSRITQSTNTQRTLPLPWGVKSASRSKPWLDLVPASGPSPFPRTR